MKKGAIRLALAVLAILTAATLAACGSHPPNPPPSPAQPAHAGPAATTPSKPTTAQPAGRPAAGSATASSGTDFGFIRGWTAKSGIIYLRFDRAVLLTFVHNGGPRPAATPFHLTYNDNGLVVRVQEQYVP